MEPIDGEQAQPDRPTIEQTREIVRRITAMQAALLDPSIPRRTRELEVRETFAFGQGYALVHMVGLASTRFNRARPGLVKAKAKTLPLKEIRKLIPHVNDDVAEPCLSLFELYVSTPGGNSEGARQINALLDSGKGFAAFVALAQIADGLAALAVQYSPMLRTREDLIRREALEMEQRFIGD